MSNNTKGCSCSGGCCTPEQEKKKVDIDFLYLDLKHLRKDVRKLNVI